MFLVVKANDALAILLPPNNTNAIKETDDEAIATKIKNLTDDLQEKSGLKIMKDISEFNDEPVFNEMFSLLRNFLTPYVATEDDIATKNSTALPQVFGMKKSHNGGGCSHKNRNSTRKQEDYVQVWFLMKLPKNKTSHRNIEYLLEHFFEELVHDFEGETAPTPTTQRINSSSEKTTLETTLDYHSMPSESDSTITTTQTVLEVEETEKIDDEPTARVWNVLEGNTKRKRAAAAFKPHELNTVPFLRQLNNPLRAKRIKRDIQYISAPLINITSVNEFGDAPPKNATNATDDELIVNITNAEDFGDEATMEAENDNEVVVGDFGNTFLHVVQTERKKLAVNENKKSATVKETIVKQEEYSSAVKRSFCEALVILLVIFAVFVCEKILIV